MTTYETTPEDPARAATEYAARRDLTARTVATGDTPSGYRRFVPVNVGNVLEFGPDIAGARHWLVIPGRGNSAPVLVEYDAPTMLRAGLR